MRQREIGVTGCSKASEWGVEGRLRRRETPEWGILEKWGEDQNVVKSAWERCAGEGIGLWWGHSPDGQIDPLSC